MIVDLYEEYCLANFRVSEFSPDEAAKFQYRMSKVETIEDIYALLSEMSHHVQNELSNKDSQKGTDS